MDYFTRGHFWIACDAISGRVRESSTIEGQGPAPAISLAWVAKISGKLEGRAVSTNLRPGGKSARAEEAGWDGRRRLRERVATRQDQNAKILEKSAEILLAGWETGYLAP
jgi:hypothetical protein